MPLLGQITTSDVLHPGPPGVLTLTSEGSLSRAQYLSKESKKRSQMNSNALETLMKTTVVVKPWPSHLSSKSHVLQPLMLLAREDLPLSSLDLTAPHGELHPSRFFESHIKILELEERMAEKPCVLIARHDDSKALYAVERSNRKLYTICKLGSWISLTELATKANVSISQALGPCGAAQPSERLGRPLTRIHSHSQPKEKRLAIEALQSAVRKRVRSQSESAFEEPARVDNHQRSEHDAAAPTTSQQDETVPLGGDEPPSTVPSVLSEAKLSTSVTKTIGDPSSQIEATKESIFENIRNHYMDALYRSKGSLAYFAKGPLSRARAAFQLNFDSTLDMDDLIDYLKSLTLSTVQIDKKYRETVPGIISKLTTTVETSDEGARAKKRKLRKMRIAKNGLYPDEESQITKWWQINKPEILGDDTAVSPILIKSHLDLLRTRETQLQMIVILEVLALESLHTRENDGEGHLPGLSGEVGSEKPPVTQVTRKRNKHNLPVLVDMHADRLCIWQSTASDELRLLEDSQVHIPPSAGGQTARKASADPLKDFCTDIIMPFFATRLPEPCDGISRKFGGPVIISPLKPERAKSSSKRPEAKPGAATKRPASSLKPRTIEQALNKEQARRSLSRGPSSTIALLRSATPTVIPGLKKEFSESSFLKDVTATGQSALEAPKLLSRGSVLVPKDDAKAQRQAALDAQLKDAISSIRRPNREMAGKAIMEAAEKRTSGGLSHTRKSKKPSRHPLFQQVEVKATPVHNRFRDAMADISLGAPLIPPSSVSIIPATDRRSSTKDFLTTVPPSAIRETPVKRMISRRPVDDDDPSIPPSSPLMMRRPVLNSLAPPSTPGHRTLVLRSPSPSGMRRIFATPAKAKPMSTSLRNENEDEIAVTPVVKAVPVTKKSIFEQLGWDDDFDDL